MRSPVFSAMRYDLYPGAAIVGLMTSHAAWLNVSKMMSGFKRQNLLHAFQGRDFSALHIDFYEPSIAQGRRHPCLIEAPHEGDRVFRSLALARTHRRARCDLKRGFFRPAEGNRA